MNVNQGRNCHNYRRFNHIARHYRERGNQRRVEQGKRADYENNINNCNLNGMENLIVLD